MISPNYLPESANSLEGILLTCNVCQTIVAQNQNQAPYVSAVHYSQDNNAMVCDNAHVTLLLPTKEALQRQARYMAKHPEKIQKTELIVCAS